MVGILELVGAVVVGLLAVAGTAFVLLGTDDGSGSETRLTDWGLVAAMLLFVGILVWSLWTVS